MITKKLYLSSQSTSRQKLLDLAGIPYQVIQNTSDEYGVDISKPFAEYVLAIAQHKMEHIVLTGLPKQEPIFVLTADTLSRMPSTGTILGKPKDINEAKHMLALQCKEPIELATGCCLDKKEYKNNKWVTVEKEHWVTKAMFEFCVTEKDVGLYLKKVPQALYACGAGIVENFGVNFLRRVEGSYTAITGLPLYELRQALKKLSFL